MEKTIDVSTLSADELVAAYNYPTFTREHYSPWMRFEQSPPLGQLAPDFPLWQLEDRAEVNFGDIWSSNTYTVVEFGSFT